MTSGQYYNKSENKRFNLRDKPLILFWNVENMFDYLDDVENVWDDDFTPMGQRYWNSYKFYKKCRDIGKIILAIGDRYGGVPDVIGLAEVENSFVLRAIINTDVLKKLGYSYVHFESIDRRGIDVALLYRKKNINILKTDSYDILNMATRNILYVKFSFNKDVYNVLVNHHPSKYGGEKESIIKRTFVLNRMNGIVDSLMRCGESNIVAMGDFNEEANNEIFVDVEQRLNNMGRSLLNKDLGTIRYKGRWNLIDNFFLSKGLASNLQMEIVWLPFLLEEDKTYGGVKIRRTYIQTLYQGGISDHLPIVLGTF